MFGEQPENLQTYSTYTRPVSVWLSACVAIFFSIALLISHLFGLTWAADWSNINFLILGLVIIFGLFLPITIIVMSIKLLLAKSFLAMFAGVKVLFLLLTAGFLEGQLTGISSSVGFYAFLISGIFAFNVFVRLHRAGLITSKNPFTARPIETA